MIGLRRKRAIVLCAHHWLTAALLDVTPRGAANLTCLVRVFLQCAHTLAVSRLVQCLGGLFGEASEQQFKRRHAVTQVVPRAEALDLLMFLHLDLECSL